MDSEHVAPKRVDSRIVPIAVDRWKAVFKEIKRALVPGRSWRYRRRGGRGQRGRQWLCSLGLFNVSMRNGIVSGPLDFVPLKWLSTTGCLAQLTKCRHVAHSLNTSSKTLFPVG